MNAFTLPDNDKVKFKATVSSSSLPRRPEKGKDWKEFGANYKDAIEKAK